MGLTDLRSRAATAARSRWTDKPEGYEHAVYANRRRLKRAKSKRYQRLRSERCERTFAHVCDSGGMRRSWLKGVAKVTKRYLIAVAAHNLGRILRKLFGIGKPRALQGEGGLAALVYFVTTALFGCRRACSSPDRDPRPSRLEPVPALAPRFGRSKKAIVQRTAKPRFRWKPG